MDENLGLPALVQPLSAGNIVTIGAKLYRSHLKEYFLIAFKAYFWLLVPIYGYAKCLTLLALISRLAFGELVNQPESIKSGEIFVNARKWKFLRIFRYSLLIGFGVFFLVSILVGILIAALSPIFTKAYQEMNLTTLLILSLLGIGLFVGLILGITWLLTRLYLADIPMAIEENMNGTKSISRSWALTRGNTWRIVLVSFISSFIILPFQLVYRVITFVLQLSFVPLFQQDPLIFRPIFWILYILIFFTNSALIMPFFQAIKGVIYYDLRSRREGLGLQLREY